MTNDKAVTMSREFKAGFTDPVGDCGKFEASIDVDSWGARIAVYGDTAEDAEQLRAEVMAALAAPVVERKVEAAAMQWQYESGSVWWAFDAENVGANIESGTKIRLTDAAGHILFRYPPSPTAPVAVDAAKAFAKGFNTLETIDGKYKIVMQFTGRDDAWAAYTELSHMTTAIDKVKELNQ